MGGLGVQCYVGLCLRCLLHGVDEQYGSHWQDSFLNILIQ